MENTMKNILIIIIAVFALLSVTSCKKQTTEEAKAPVNADAKAPSTDDVKAPAKEEAKAPVKKEVKTPVKDESTKTDETSKTESNIEVEEELGEPRQPEGDVEKLANKAAKGSKSFWKKLFD
jgi:hypothetical protein